MNTEIEQLRMACERDLGDPTAWPEPTAYPNSLALCIIDAIYVTGARHLTVEKVVERYRGHPGRSRRRRRHRRCHRTSGKRPRVRRPGTMGIVDRQSASYLYRKECAAAGSRAGPSRPGTHRPGYRDHLGPAHRCPGRRALRAGQSGVVRGARATVGLHLDVSGASRAVARSRHRRCGGRLCGP